jgi:hypothetical protein
MIERELVSEMSVFDSIFMWLIAQEDFTIGVHRASTGLCVHTGLHDVLIVANYVHCLKVSLECTDYSSNGPSYSALLSYGANCIVLYSNAIYRKKSIRITSFPWALHLNFNLVF